MSTREEAVNDVRFEDLERRMDAVEKAFPNDDPQSHRQYHEALIDQNRDRKKLIAAVKEKTVAGLVWAIMLGIGIACWKYFMGLIAAGLGKGP